MLLETAAHAMRPESAPITSPESLLAGPFRARDGVLTARALDAAALYDPHRERYFTLNPVATRIWELLNGGLTGRAITAHLCAEFEAPPEQVARDVAHQIEGFVRDGLITPGRAAAESNGQKWEPPRTQRDARKSTAPARSEIRVPSVGQCGLALIRIKWLLGRRRFEGTLAWLRAETRHVQTTEAASLSEVRAMEYAVALAAAFYPGRARCLEQSFVLYYVARRQGIAVRYCQGMQLYPFEAHAWIEYQGEVINDVPEHIRHFTRFPDQLP